MKYINTRNPVLPLNYHVPDSKAHKMSDGKFYIFGSLDKYEGIYCSEE